MALSQTCGEVCALQRQNKTGRHHVYTRLFESLRQIWLKGASWGGKICFPLTLCRVGWEQQQINTAKVKGPKNKMNSVHCVIKFFCCIEKNNIWTKKLINNQSRANILQTWWREREGRRMWINTQSEKNLLFFLSVRDKEDGVEKKNLKWNRKYFSMLFFSSKLFLFFFSADNFVL